MTGVQTCALPISTFRGLRIQEQDIPVEELLSSGKKERPNFALLGVIGAAGIALLVFLVILIVKPSGNNSADEAVHETVQYKMDSKIFEKRLYPGDTVTVPYNNENFAVTLKQIDDTVLFQTPSGSRNFMLGEEGSIDLDKDNVPEIYVFISDFQKNAPSVGALIRFTASDSLSVAPLADTAEPKPAQTITATVPPKTTEKSGSFVSAIFTGKRSPYPFTANVTFRNYAMFRYEIDKKTREEKYFRKGDLLTVNATNSMTIWCSNAGSPKITILASGGQNAEIEIGNPGEVSVRALRWTQADDGTWTLGLYQLD